MTTLKNQITKALTQITENFPCNKYILVQDNFKNVGKGHVFFIKEGARDAAFSVINLDLENIFVPTINENKQKIKLAEKIQTYIADIYSKPFSDSGQPILLIEPKAGEDISDILKLCEDKKIPLIIRCMDSISDFKVTRFDNVQDINTAFKNIQPIDKTELKDKEIYPKIYSGDIKNRTKVFFIPDISKTRDSFLKDDNTSDIKKLKN